ncbi:MAG TPA: hypothetical protein VKQ72_08565, partial [Aggregatilineales bacterium]|nr:hypothetical protein [Aggregatilineales bacterium]
FVQHAINDSRRLPNLVLTGHVHNYQRIERNLIDGTATPFLVVGNGGYFHLHGMNADDGTVDDQTGAKLIMSDHHNHGYLTLAVDAHSISGSLTSVATDGSISKNTDQFSYGAAAQFLADGVMVSL